MDTIKMPKSADSKIFAINRIVDSKFDKVSRRWLFLVRWKGYNKSADTWEPRSNLRSCGTLVQKFLAGRQKTVKCAAKKKTATETGQTGRTAQSQRRLKHSGRHASQRVSAKKPGTLKKAVPRKSLKQKVRLKSDIKRGKKRVDGTASESDDDADVYYSLISNDESGGDTSLGASASEDVAPDVGKDNLITPSSAAYSSTKSTPIKEKSFTSLLGTVYSSSSYSPKHSRSAVLAFPLSIADVPNMLPTMPSSPEYSAFDMSAFNVAKKHDSVGDPPSDAEDERIERRRLSVRQAECAFRYKNIAVKKCQRYTQVWLNTQTQQKNALNPSVIEELLSVLNTSKFDDTCLLMLSALSGVFCSGVDLHYLLAGDKKVSALKMVDAVRDLCKALITFPKPIVVVVNGPAIGLGMALLPLCDIVYASDKATFYLPYSRLRQTPEGCASFTLPSILGLAMANDMLMGGRKITATEAHALGLVSRVLWPTCMMEEIVPHIDKITMNSAKAMATSKLLVRSHQRTKLELTNESECNLLLDRWLSNECREAIQTYLDGDIEKFL